jgi:hypothetical protein
MRYLYYIAVVVLAGAIAFVFLFHGKSARTEPMAVIPEIGAVQILNGCGVKGAANVIGEYLRNKGFDVKESANAPDWNYKETIVASRVKTMQIANMAGAALHTDNIIPLMSNKGMFDVTVFVGQDYQKLVSEEK